MDGLPWGLLCPVLWGCDAVPSLCSAYAEHVLPVQEMPVEMEKESTGARGLTAWQPAEGGLASQLPRCPPAQLLPGPLPLLLS